MKTECMDVAMFGGYVEGSLTEVQKDRMEEHLLDCDECLEEFVMLKTQLNDIQLDAYQPGPLDAARAAMGQIREKLKSLYKWMTELPPPAWILQYDSMAVRSTAQPKTFDAKSIWLVKQMRNLRTEMYIRKDKPENVCIWIKVFEGEKGAKNVSLTLIKDGGRPLARFLNRDYEFFDKIGHGTYALVLEQSAEKKGDYLFRIDNEGVHER